MKIIDQHFIVVELLLLYKIVLTFKSVDKTLECDYSNESYREDISCGIVYHAVSAGSIF